MYDDIPEAFREGVSGVIVEEEARVHPTLPGIWTLGECVTEYWPDALGGGDTRSEIVVYHGSFVELAAADAHFEWEEELWETMLHELLHHREASADEEGLDVFDWAADQNFRRLAGLDFDPFFHRVLPVDPEGNARLEGETFVDVRLGAADTEATFVWRGRSWSLRVPADIALLWARARNLAGARLWVIAERRVSWWRRLLSREQPDLWVLDRRVLPAPPA
jgi:hypothetical protein